MKSSRWSAKTGGARNYGITPDGKQFMRVFNSARTKSLGFSSGVIVQSPTH